MTPDQFDKHMAVQKAILDELRKIRGQLVKQPAPKALVPLPNGKSIPVILSR